MSKPQQKPPAALSSALLARKGHARPAMRPQGYGGFGPPHDDLGWNDMGEDPAPVPPVLLQREALREEYASGAIDPVAADAAPAMPDAAVPSPEPIAAGKAAFTLRLDAARHLRLRLASATRHLSAQQLVIEALDAFLTTLPEVEELASQLPRPAA